MGSLGDNGGGRPPDGGGQFRGLPGLPPEWGVVVIPDDASELDRESRELRRELRRNARRRDWRRRLGVPDRDVAGSQDDEIPALGLPILIMCIAVIATLASLFALSWPVSRGPSSLINGADRQNSTAAAVLPDVTLRDAHGAPVALRDLHPAVVLLVDGCSCTDLVDQVAAAATGGLVVVAIGATVPPVATTVIALADPGGQVRAALAGSPNPGPTLGASPPAHGASVILVARDGALVATLQLVTAPAEVTARMRALTA